MREVVSDGARIQYDVMGDGPAVMLIHGLGASHRYWKPQEELAEHFRLVLPDVRGFGNSEAKGPYTVKQAAKDLLLIAMKENVEHVVGVSLGGLIAQVLASARPFSSVTLVSTFMRVGLRIPLPVIHRAVENIHAFLHLVPPSLPRVREEIMTSDRGVMEAYLGDVMSYDGAGVVRGISSPVLVVHGGRDVVVPAMLGRQLADTLSAPFVVFPRATHFVNYEEKEAFNALLTGWILSHTR